MLQNQNKQIHKRVLGVDIGLKRVGLALSDTQKIIASPLENLIVSQDLIHSVGVFVAFLEKLPYALEAIVVGLPLKMDGSDSTMTSHVRQFVKLLQEKVEIPVELMDERLSSVQADRSLMSANFTRKKRAQFVDRVSAVIMLRCYLDKRSRNV